MNNTIDVKTLARALDSFEQPPPLTAVEKDKMRQRYMKKHDVAVMLLHWFNAVSWFFLLLTGAGLLISPHYKVMPKFFLEITAGLFSGRATMLEFHIWLGVTWILVITTNTIFGYRRYVRKMRLRDIRLDVPDWERRLKAIQCAFFANEELCLDRDDLRWLKIRLLGILGKTDEPLPPQGSFNAGQKLFGLLVALMTPLIMLTGLIMAFHLISTFFVAWSVPLHFMAVGLIVSGLMIHVYMGAVFPEEKPAFFSMVTGRVNELFVYQHHFKFWKERILQQYEWRLKTDGQVQIEDVLPDRLAEMVREKIAGMAPIPEREEEPPRKPRPYWQPYLVGVLLGLLLLFTFFTLGRGLGASSGFARIDALLWNVVSPNHAHNSPVWGRYYRGGSSPLSNFVIFELIGVLIGGFLSGYGARRIKISVDKGPAINRKKRLIMALLGGTVMGIGARIARGCTSGLALTGGATLAVGGWVFMVMVFAGGFIGAYFVRRLWI